jgi:hypothetical protein
MERRALDSARTSALDLHDLLDALQEAILAYPPQMTELIPDRPDHRGTDTPTSQTECGPSPAHSGSSGVSKDR